MQTEWKCLGCGEMNPDEVDSCINCRDDRPGRSADRGAQTTSMNIRLQGAVATPVRPSTYSSGTGRADGPTLDEIIAVLRKTPAGSESVQITCHMLVLQIMCGKIDGDRAGYRLRQIMGESDPGYNALSNAATAIGALSAIGK